MLYVWNCVQVLVFKLNIMIKFKYVLVHADGQMLYVWNCVQVLVF